MYKNAISYLQSLILLILKYTQDQCDSYCVPTMNPNLTVQCLATLVNGNVLLCTLTYNFAACNRHL
jgi:hypothetical protein